MYRFINLLLLAQVSFPFLKIYLAYRQLKKGKGELHVFWSSVKSKIETLQSLEGSLQRRIFHYLFANTLTTQWFATLLHHKATHSELLAGHYLAIATPIADFLVDHENLTTQDIYEMLDQKSTHPWQNLTKQLFNFVITHHPSPELANKLILSTLQAQEESLKQQDIRISEEKLKEITWAKGGYALLLYRSTLKPEITVDEWNAVYHLGGLMQLHNDIFDLYRDLQEGIMTLPSQTKSIKQLNDLFNEEIDLTFRLFDRLPLKTRQKHKFYLLLHLAVHTGHHCLKQFSEVENKKGEFIPAKLSRRELVCDMDDLKKISQTVLATINKKYR